jgi:hypothetical protein
MDVRTWVKISESMREVERLTQVILLMQEQITRLEDRLKAVEGNARAYRRKSVAQGD